MLLIFHMNNFKLWAPTMQVTQFTLFKSPEYLKNYIDAALIRV